MSDELIVNVGMLRIDDFNSCFVEWAKGIMSLVSDTMGKPVASLDGDDVVEGFGAVLGGCLD